MKKNVFSSFFHHILIVAFILQPLHSLAGGNGKGSEGVDQPKAKAKPGSFFSKLSVEKGDPNEYTLVCLDSSLVPSSRSSSPPKKRSDLKAIWSWLKKDLIEDLEDDSPTKSVDCVERVFRGRRYYIVQLNKLSSVSPAESLTMRLRGGRNNKPQTEEYAASLFIFPQPETTRALAYLMCGWKQVVNSHAIVPDWGLRLVASEALFSDSNVKSLVGNSVYTSNPTSRSETKQRLDKIEFFDLEVGAEGLKSLRVLPRYALGTPCQRVIKGQDFIRFSFAAAKTAGQGNTLEALTRMVFFFDRISQKKPRIHPKLRGFIDEEVRSKKLRKALDARLGRLLSSNDAIDMVFPSPMLWRNYGKSPIFRIGKGKRNKNLITVLRAQKKLSLADEVHIKKANKKRVYTEPLARIIYTLPVEYKRRFYRYDSSRWFEVAPSRFDQIIRRLRSPDIKTQIPGLSDYTLADEEGDNGKYQEDRYNRRIAAEASSGQTILLLDRINVSFGGAGNQFEFGDLLIQDRKGPIYIVHVKRKEAGQIDHHRTQVERCAEFLASELKRGNTENLLLQGYVNGAYLSSGLEPKGVSKKDPSLTHDNYFQNRYKKNPKKKKESWSNYLKKKIFVSPSSKSLTRLKSLVKILRGLDLSFFRDNRRSLFIGLDALYGCCKRKTKLTKASIENYIEGLRQVIQLQEILFPNGVMTQAIKRRINLVFAVIDDRYIKGLVKKKKGKRKTDPSRKREGPLFLKQQLWGLDRTRQLVQKLGFPFKIAVLNENTERAEWDAFGSIGGSISVKREEDSDDSEQSESDSGNEFSFSDYSQEDGDGSESGDQQQVREYEYNSTDIMRLLHTSLEEVAGDNAYRRFSLSGAPVDAAADTNDIVHVIDETYILPPIVRDVGLTPLATLKRTVANTLVHDEVNNPRRLIIPYNPGGHWVTLDIGIPAEGAISFEYIESIEPEGREAVQGLLWYLEALFRRNDSNYQSFVGWRQPDSVSCGAITVNVIEHLCRGDRIARNNHLSTEGVLQLKTEHQLCLQNMGVDFDF